jgi:hypothetical protein
MNNGKYSPGQQKYEWGLLSVDFLRIFFAGMFSTKSSMIHEHAG